MIRVHLLSVRFQPVFAIVDGNSVKEFENAVVRISAEDWPSYLAETFPKQVQEFQRSLNTKSQRKKR